MDYQQGQKFVLLVVYALSIACEPQKKPVFDPIAEEATIRAILDAEQIAWNNGDLEAFMQGYWKSDSLQFMSPRGANRGWQHVLDEYKTAYPDRAAMGTLSYEVLQVSPLSEIYYVVRH
ncbi:hypothetical protein BH10BAC4_BH10BAC4_24620 [soil metagenome]